jgi:hypothetical protein
MTHSLTDALITVRLPRYRLNIMIPRQIIFTVMTKYNISVEMFFHIEFHFTLQLAIFTDYNNDNTLRELLPLSDTILDECACTDDIDTHT